MCSIRSSSGAIMADPVSARVAKLEAVCADLASQIETIAPVVADQIDDLRKALVDERSERQSANAKLLKSIEASREAHVADGASNISLEKFADDISSASAKLKAELEGRLHDVEMQQHQGIAKLEVLKLQQGSLIDLPFMMRELQGKLMAVEESANSSWSRIDVIEKKAEEWHRDSEAQRTAIVDQAMRSNGILSNVSEGRQILDEISAKHGLERIEEDGVICSPAAFKQFSERLAAAEERLKAFAKDSGSSVIIAKESKDASNLNFEGTTAAQLTDLVSSQTSLRMELASIRADVRKFTSIDVQSMQNSVQRLLLQADSARRSLENIEKRSMESLRQEVQDRLRGDQKVEQTIVRLGHDAEIQFGLLRDVLQLFSNRESQQHQQMQPGNEDAAPKPENVALGLQGKLESIIAKLDTRCLDNFGPQLKELNSLLSAKPCPDQKKRGESLDRKGASARLTPIDRLSGSYPTQPVHQPPEGLHGISEDSLDMQEDASVANDKTADTSSRVSASSAPSDTEASLQSLKADIVGCLRSEFQEQLSEIRKGLRSPDSFSQIVPKPAPQVGASSSTSQVAPPSPRTSVPSHSQPSGREEAQPRTPESSSRSIFSVRSSSRQSRVPNIVGPPMPAHGHTSTPGLWQPGSPRAALRTGVGHRTGAQYEQVASRTAVRAQPKAGSAFGFNVPTRMRSFSPAKADTPTVAPIRPTGSVGSTTASGSGLVPVGNSTPETWT